MSDLANNLKNPNRREPARFLHVLVMGADGQTRRLSLSISFLWLMGCFSLVVLGALGVVAYLWVEAARDRDSLGKKLDWLSRRGELASYQKEAQQAPVEARRLLEELNSAAQTADNGDEVGGKGSAPPPNPEPSTETGAPGAQTNLTATATNTTVTVNGSINLSAATNSSLVEPGPESRVELGPEVDPAIPSSSSAVEPDSPEAKAWAAFWGSWPNPPGASSQLTVEDFKIAGGGQFTYVLKRLEGPAPRARGRSVSIFAVADSRGEVKLVGSPEFNLQDPLAGYQVGARYNIMSSKIMRGKIPVPRGGRLLSLEILAWDEDSRELVLRQRIKLGER
ncbi:MAG: hypothetical protein LBR11_08290 [Deltaproteobacteria bacterium]|nr:hypothetical protein [Deltaproteobacteria bacterium]